jgi:VCBS repeat-containing protein
MDATCRSDCAPSQNRGMPRRKLFPLNSAGSLAALALGAILVLPTGVERGVAQGSGPFAPLAGNWSGTGSVSFSSSGSHERLRCRAVYQAPDAGQTLALRLRCASDSYNFDLNGNLTHQGDAVSGQWIEFTRNVTGTLSGRLSGASIQAVASAGIFTANLTLTTHGTKQQVSIRIQGTEVTEAAISLSKS